MKKGIELPVNVLVIVAVAVIVLLGIIALFMSGFGGAAGTFVSTSEWNEACAPVIANCGANHANTNNFGEVCGIAKRYDPGLVVYTAVTYNEDGSLNTAASWTAGTNWAATYPAATDYSNTLKNGCNKACGCQ